MEYYPLPPKLFVEFRGGSEDNKKKALDWFEEHGVQFVCVSRDEWETKQRSGSSTSSQPTNRDP